MKWWTKWCYVWHPQGSPSLRSVHRLSLESGSHIELGRDPPILQGHYMPMVCKSRLNRFPDSAAKTRKVVSFSAYSLCKHSSIPPLHLCLPLAPQIHPQVAGSLTGRSNLTKISKPSSQHTLTLLFFACPSPPPKLHHSRDLLEGSKAVPHLLIKEECKVFRVSDILHSLAKSVSSGGWKPGFCAVWTRASYLTSLCLGSCCCCC